MRAGATSSTKRTLKLEQILLKLTGIAKPNWRRENRMPCGTQMVPVRNESSFPSSEGLLRKWYRNQRDNLEASEVDSRFIRCNDGFQTILVRLQAKHSPPRIGCRSETSKDIDQDALMAHFGASIDSALHRNKVVKWFHVDSYSIRS
jgi:hypothetical protein